MKTKNVAHIIAVFLFLFFAYCSLPVVANAQYTNGNSSTTLLPANYFSGLTIGPVEQYVTGSQNTLQAWVRNNDTYTKMISTRKLYCRCQESTGYPSNGQCQYYWTPDANQAKSSCQSVVENIALPPRASTLISVSASQYNNQACGSFQLGLFMDRINAGPPMITYPYSYETGPWATSFANMGTNCPTPVTNTACTTTSTVPVYRSWNGANGDHLYTTSVAERDAAAKNGWVPEGIAYYAFNTQVSASVPVYRSWNSGNGDHLYTTSVAERDAAAKNGWVPEGIAYYAFNTSVSGSVPVYRSWNSGNGDHLYTTSFLEWNAAAKNGWVPEGIAYYAFNSQNSLTTGNCNLR